MMEIERKFLVKFSWLSLTTMPSLIEQVYLSDSPCTRIRAVTDSEGGSKAFLTVKGSGLIERVEVECELPVATADQIVNHGLWNDYISKNRYRLDQWEIDEFLGLHNGLWIAEIELENKDESFDKPEWLGPEVSEDPRFSNIALARDGVPEKYWDWYNLGVWA